MYFVTCCYCLYGFGPLISYSSLGFIIYGPIEAQKAKTRKLFRFPSPERFTEEPNSKLSHSSDLSAWYLILLSSIDGKGMQFFGGSEISPSPPVPTASGNNAHMMYVFNRNGVCLLYKEWNRPLHTLNPQQDHKLMFGLLFSLKSLTAKMDPVKLDFSLSFDGFEHFRFDLFDGCDLCASFW